MVGNRGSVIAKNPGTLYGSINETSIWKGCHQLPDETMATESIHKIDNTSQDTLIRMEDVSVEFDMDRGTSKVLDNVNLEVNRGEILGIVGESGSGKSMLASALLDAVEEPGRTEGSVTYYSEDGQETDVLKLSKEELRTYRWEEVSLVFQGAMSSFNPTTKIRTHFVETLKSHDYSVEDHLEETRETLRDLYLDPDRVFDSYPHELSGGMKQRVLIALSLVLDPELLVLDEPTAALDLLMQQSILQLLREVKEKYNVAMVFITHDLPLVADLADRLAVMYAFELAEIGPTDEILHESRHPYTRALLNSTPNLSAPIEQMRPIEGSSPDPIDIPAGCSYHPRCPLADEKCQVEDPELMNVKENHYSACFYQDRVPDEVHYVSTQEDSE